MPDPPSAQLTRIIDHTRDAENRGVHQVEGSHIRIEGQAGLVRCEFHVFEHIQDKLVMLLEALLRAEAEVLLLEVEPLLLQV